ncbi:MAG TPA: hypothetical protein VM345_12340 [Acidimicrobiales bacterium]|nr:hypothetical protein [Acidimicrobiales bacterium]
MPAVPDLVRTVEVLEAETPAIVLGSTQRDDVVDRDECEAAGVEVARRRSGGGAVLVDPAEVLWVDVLVPHGDPLWVDDVNRSTAWLGRAWVSALREVGAIEDPVVHEGAICLNRWGRLVCFAGLGPGEVTSGAGGPKVVGISQRRTRDGARFQCAVPFRWEPRRITSLLRFESATARDEATRELSLPGMVRPVDPALRSRLLDAFLETLPTS